MGQFEFECLSNKFEEPLISRGAVLNARVCTDTSMLCDGRLALARN